MFTVPIDIIAKQQKWSKYLWTGEWKNKMCPSVQRNELVIHATTDEPENCVVGERNQTQRPHIVYIWLHFYEMSRKDQHTENRSVVAYKWERDWLQMGKSGIFHNNRKKSPCSILCLIWCLAEFSEFIFGEGATEWVGAWMNEQMKTNFPEALSSNLNHILHSLLSASATYV